jgi:hypothetical protein
MNETGTELAKTLGVNGTVLGVTTLSDLEIILKIVLLVVTIIWTGIKILSFYERDTPQTKEKKCQEKKNTHGKPGKPPRQG